mmetsp:Transcript_128924/g.241138  ORF Transcript_128924/g.241138 Transcript_128924/m.241138 type:complete len:281 (-) Transcript_128924:17-859(-)
MNLLPLLRIHSGHVRHLQGLCGRLARFFGSWPREMLGMRSEARLLRRYHCYTHGVRRRQHRHRPRSWHHLRCHDSRPRAAQGSLRSSWQRCGGQRHRGCQGCQCGNGSRRIPLWHLRQRCRYGDCCARPCCGSCGCRRACRTLRCCQLPVSSCKPCGSGLRHDKLAIGCRKLGRKHAFRSRIHERWRGLPLPGARTLRAYVRPAAGTGNHCSAGEGGNPLHICNRGSAGHRGECWRISRHHGECRQGRQAGGLLTYISYCTGRSLQGFSSQLGQRGQGRV